MEDANIFLDVPSPSNTTYQYLYGDHDQYLENSHSESHSSATSPVSPVMLQSLIQQFSYSPGTTSTI